MPIAHELEYARPGTIEEALGLLEKHGAGARVLAGGTDVVPALRDGNLKPDIVIDIKAIEELRALTCGPDVVRLGALTTFTEIIESEAVLEHAPLLHEMAVNVASVGVRNRATVAGNICSAVPSCDSGTVLLVHGAVVHVIGPGGERVIPIADWFTEPKKTSLDAAELVTSVTFPVPPVGYGGAYVKLRRYRGEDLAQASVAVLALGDGGYRVAFGAVAATPVRAPKIETLLTGAELSDSLIEEAKRLVAEETAPIADIRASREYREHMLPVMLERGIRAAVERRAGGGPGYGTPHI